MEDPVSITVYVQDGQGTDLATHDLAVDGMSVVQINDLFDRD